MLNQRSVDCPDHGSTPPAFVCAHLLSGTKLGFIKAEAPHPTDPSDDDFVHSPNAWCSACEQVRIRLGGWTDESEAFANVTMVCLHCFEQIRERNAK